MKKIRLQDFVEFSGEFGNRDKFQEELLKHYNALRVFNGESPIDIPSAKSRDFYQQLKILQERITQWVARNMLRDLVRRRILLVGSTWRDDKIIKEIRLATGEVLLNYVKDGVKRGFVASNSYVISWLGEHFSDGLVPVTYDPPFLPLFDNYTSHGDVHHLAESNKRKSLFKGRSKKLPFESGLSEPGDYPR